MIEFWSRSRESERVEMLGTGKSAPEEWPTVLTADITPTFPLLHLTDEVLDCVKPDRKTDLLKVTFYVK